MQENTKKIFVDKFSNAGSDGFYKFLIFFAIQKITENNEKSFPQLDLMDYYDKFLHLYRRENNSVYLDIARQFRKAAHKIYRIMLKKKLATKNNRFLNLVDKCQ